MEENIQQTLRLKEDFKRVTTEMLPFEEQFPSYCYLHTGQHQAITDKVGGVAHAFARFETEKYRSFEFCVCDLQLL